MLSLSHSERMRASACDSAPMNSSCGRLYHLRSVPVCMLAIGLIIFPSFVHMPLCSTLPSTVHTAIRVESLYCIILFHMARAPVFSTNGNGNDRAMKFLASLSPTYTAMRPCVSDVSGLRSSPDAAEYTVSPVDSCIR